MSSAAKAWLLLRSYNIPPPPDGPLHLGSIISNLEDPLSSYLNINVSLENVHEAVQYDFQERSESQHAKLFGLLGTQLSVMDLSIEQLVTTFITPSRNYLDAVTSDSEFQNFIKAVSWGTAVYMVTGLKVARGISFKERKGRKGEKKPELAVPVTQTGSGAAALVPGRAVEGTARNRHATSSSGLLTVPSDIVFAIRVVKIKYRSPQTTNSLTLTPAFARFLKPTNLAEDNRTQYESTPEELLKEEKNIEELEKELTRRKKVLKTQKADMGLSTAPRLSQERSEKDDVDGMQALPPHISNSGVGLEQEYPVDKPLSVEDGECGDKVQEPPPKSTETKVKPEHPPENENQIEKPQPSGEESSDPAQEDPSQVSNIVAHVNHRTSGPKCLTDSRPFGTDGEGSHKVQELPLLSQPESTAVFIENYNSDADSTHFPDKSSVSCGLAFFGRYLTESEEQRKNRKKKELLDKALKLYLMDD